MAATVIEQHSSPETLQEDLALYEAKWPITARRKYHAEHPEYFAGTEGDKPLSYPIRDADDVRSAVTLYGKSANPEQCKRNIIRITKALKLTAALPDAWKSGDDAKESLALTEAAFEPKPRIAQLCIRFIRDNAISRNGRQYPPAARAALVRSGQQAIERGEILTSCISHEAADNQENNPLRITGKASRVWQEGPDGFALFDIPDTTTGRDMVALLRGGYIPPTMSLRASGAVMKVERGKDIPQVTGDLQLEGIDFTSQPGLEIARIQDLVLESSGAPQLIVDEFDVTEATLLLEQQQEEGQLTMKKQANGTESQTPAPSTESGTPETQPIAEHANAILQSQTSGISQSVDGGTQGDGYANRVFPRVGATIPPEDFFNGGGGGVSAQEARTAHDHMAALLGMPCAPGGASESATNRFFNKTMESHAVAVHDLHARKLGLPCAGSYQQMAPFQDTPTTDDGPDDDSMESADADPGHTPPATTTPAVVPPVVAKENKHRMDEKEALALLQARGYTGMQPPKTKEQLLREELEAKLDAKLAEQRTQFEESQRQMLAQFAPAQPRAQRVTLVESARATREGGGEPLPNSPRARRTRVQEALMKANWEQLADPSQPLPEGVTWQDLLKHFGRLMITDYQHKYGAVTIRPHNS